MEFASCHLCVLLASLKIYRQVSFYVISFCAVSLLHDLKIYTTFPIYMIIFGLTQFGTNDL